MLQMIPEDTIQTLDIFQIVENIFREYPDMIAFLHGRIGTMTDGGSHSEKRDQFIDINQKMLRGELTPEDQEEMMLHMQREKDDFRQEVFKHMQIERQKRFSADKEYTLISQEHDEAENLLMNL